MSVSDKTGNIEFVPRGDSFNIKVIYRKSFEFSDFRYRISIYGSYIKTPRKITSK